MTSYQILFHSVFGSINSSFIVITEKSVGIKFLTDPSLYEMLDTISYPLFAYADTGIYPHAALQYHARPSVVCDAKCG